MYYNKNLTKNLVQLVERLNSASHEQYGNHLKYLLAFIDGSKQLTLLLDEACERHPLKEELLTSVMEQGNYGRVELEFENEVDHASYSYTLLKYVTSNHGYNLHRMMMFQGQYFENTKERILDELIKPVIYYLGDRLDESSSVIYLLEKYKKRTEWFTKASLMETYSNATKNYEQIFEDDLRMFLFDQGIEYPFSTPKSASGRADVIGDIDTSNPLIVEIKLLDKNRKYGKERIKEGFTQIVKYTNDYNKDVGYLVVFNIDNTEIKFNFKSEGKSFPPRIVFNNKTYYLIVVDMTLISASQAGKMNTITIEESELTN